MPALATPRINGCLALASISDYEVETRGPGLTRQYPPDETAHD
jgi:hypothetical protein